MKQERSLYPVIILYLPICLAGLLVLGTISAWLLGKS